MTLLLVVAIIYIVSITILFIYCYKVKKVQRAADRNRRILIDHATALLIKQEYFISAICNGNIHDPGFTIEISHFLTDYVFKCILKGTFESFKKEEFAFSGTTDSKGEIEILPLRGGKWILLTKVVKPYEGKDCDEISYSSTLSFQVK